MNGALAVLHRNSEQLSFVTRVNLPIGKLSDLVNFMKWINFIRTGNMNLAHDSLHDIESMLRDIKSFITADNDKAAKAFNDLGVSNFFCTVLDLKTVFGSKTLGSKATMIC